MNRSLFLVVFLFLFPPFANADLTIGAPEPVSERRIGRTIFEYTMRAKLTNPGPAAAAISATVTSSSPRTTVVQGTVNFGNVGPLTTADSTDTFIIAHDRTVPFDPAVLHWTIRQPFLVSSYTPQAGASEVGVTVRPQVFFSKPIDPATLNANNFFATDTNRAKLPATIVPSGDCTFAWLFFTAPMPGAAQVQVTVDGSTIRLKGTTDLLDAAGTGTPGSRLTFDFSTVSVAPVPGTTLSSRIVDPGPDLLPRTADDVTLGGNGYNYLLPIAGVKVYVLGQETNVAYTDATGRFSLANMPVGDVKVVLDGRTATAAPAGTYFPEMVIDTTFSPGVDNGVMTIRDANGEVVRDGNGVPIKANAMYLPRVASTILQTVSASQPTMVTLRPEAALTLPPAQQPYLTVEIQPGSLVKDGQPVATGQVGISVVPPELVKDMLPPGLLQHTFDITVQAPGITNFSTPAAMTFPNVFNAPPGTKQQFLSFDHTTGRLVFEGTATVSMDGLSVHTDPGTGITHPGWHGLTPPGRSGGPPPPPRPCIILSSKSAPINAAASSSDEQECLDKAYKNYLEARTWAHRLYLVSSAACIATALRDCAISPVRCIPIVLPNEVVCLNRAQILMSKIWTVLDEHTTPLWRRVKNLDALTPIIRSRLCRSQVRRRT